jgi:hypothetical protein
MDDLARRRRYIVFKWVVRGIAGLCWLPVALNFWAAASQLISGRPLTGGWSLSWLVAGLYFLAGWVVLGVGRFIRWVRVAPEEGGSDVYRGSSRSRGRVEPKL